MRLSTHYVFTTGMLSILGWGTNFYYGLILASLISLSSNTIIDRLGHEVRGGYVRRTPRTHTLGRSILWGLIPSFFIFLFLFLVSGGLLFQILSMGIVAGPSHLLLDAFTEKGIYVKNGGRWTRYALAHFRYNNPFANGAAIITGVLLMLLSLYLRGQLTLI
ncbi:DUF1286 domain-containing protein [Sulfodiicoccus acidiphilus]|nr:DUF1286 domain-containing protein [Sulfodiicoccus acidiphilus]